MIKKNILLLTVVLILSSGFLVKKYDVATYQGDGDLRLLPRPGLLGSKGARLQFETFELLAGFEKELLIKNLPVFKNKYSLYFKSTRKIDDYLASNIFIQTELKDSANKILWRYGGILNEWIANERGDEITYYYMSRLISDSTVTSFKPKEDEEYILSITCKVSGDFDQDIGQGYFYLSAGGFK